MKKLFITILCLLLLTAGGMGYVWQEFRAQGAFAEDTTVIFKRGTGVSAISEELEKSGLVPDALRFRLMVYLKGTAAKFKAGEYLFPAHASPEQIMQQLVEGRVVIHKLTFAEGITTRQILEQLRDDPLLEGELPQGIKEGELLPETYHFMLGDTRADIVARMQKSLHEVLDTAWETRRAGLPFASKEEALILASIVEKETGLPEERGQVAAVFINRLNKGMRLQSDPTILYTIQQYNPSQTTIYASDLARATPYNTYVIDRLPPTPIANPGKAAIQATLNPPTSDALYFVATGTGGHRFAATLAEHNRNVQAYRQMMRR